MKITVLALLFLTFIIICVLTPDNFSPARISAFMWLCLIVGYHIFSQKELQYKGIFWLILSMSVLAAGEWVGMHVRLVERTSRGRKGDSNAITKTTWTELLFFISIGFIYDMYLLKLYGFGLSSFSSVNSFLNMNTAVAYERYYGNTSIPRSANFLCSFLYIAAITGGYLMPYADTRKKKFLCIFSFAPTVFLMLFMNTKSGIVSDVFLYMAGYIAAFVRRHKRALNVSPQMFCKVLVLAILLFVVLFCVMCIRIGSFDSRTIEHVRSKFLVYAFGNVEAFDVWFCKYRTGGRLTWGIRLIFSTS